MKTTSIASVLLATLLLATLVAADLPVHCVYPQIHGDWVFSLSDAGHPNTVINTCDAFQEMPLPVTSTMKINLSGPNTATNVLTGETGTWTLIYDQAFEVTIHGNKYFAFFNFTGSGSSVISHCGQTFTGWYHDATVNSQNWGCFRASKAQQTFNLVTIVDRSSNVQQVDAVFKNDHDYVAKLNSVQKSWTAAAYPEFEGRRLSSMVNLAGKKVSQMKRDAHKQHMQMMRQMYPTNSKDATSDLPDHWDWRNTTRGNFVSPIRNQGSCGSCFAFATTRMLADRVRVASNNNEQPIFAPQDVLNCDHYNQACNGGFSFSVSKFAQDFGILQDQCTPYAAKQEKCNRECSLAKYYVRDYHYLGGYYGACTEQLMMEAIVNNGPIAVDFEVYKDFYYYKGGVYHHVQVDDSIPEPHWEEANHVVSAIGYGVTPEGQKYWIVANSWGATWGLNGFFWIRRGTDECAIESAGVEAFPILQK